MNKIYYESNDIEYYMKFKNRELIKKTRVNFNRNSFLFLEIPYN